MTDSPVTVTDHFESEQCTIQSISVSTMDNNVYLLRCQQTGQGLLIDAADDAVAIETFIGRQGIHSLVTTHRHWDHVRALNDVLEATSARHLAGQGDADALPAAVDQRLSCGDSFQVGHLTITAIELRGHTPGAIALFWREPEGRVHLFSGDSLFPGGPGKTWSEPDFVSLMNDLEERVFAIFGDDTVVYPGHGGTTTLGAERPHLAQWRERGW